MKLFHSLTRSFCVLFCTILFLDNVLGKKDDCVFDSPLGVYDFTEHIEFGTLGPVVDSVSIFTTYLSICHDGTQACQLTPEMALRFQTPTFCSSVVGKWNNPAWELIDPSDPSGGVRQRFENGDLCFGQVSTEPSKTTIEFVCDPNADGDTYTTVSENFQCDWIFTVPSRHACGSVPVDCGDCTQTHSHPGCSEEDVEKCVCGDIGATACCDIEWSHHCADVAIASCGCIDCLDCNEPHAEPGCAIVEVEECVCSFAPICCVSDWGLPCAQISGSQCGCPPPPLEES